MTKSIFLLLSAIFVICTVSCHNIPFMGFFDPPPDYKPDLENNNYKGYLKMYSIDPAANFRLSYPFRHYNIKTRTTTTTTK